MNITVLDEMGCYRKAFKIVPYSGGGFAIVLPKINGVTGGRLEKTFVKYESLGTHLEIKRDESQQYSAKDIVKLSYHADGFVQFSTASNSKILSGRNPDGSPRGLGILSHPLDSPVSSGPSITITFWGLNNFAIQTATNLNLGHSFDVKHAIRHPKADFNEDAGLSAYAMALYIIPNSTAGYIYDIDGKKYANLTMMQLMPNGTYFARLREQVRIIDIPNQNYKIAISLFLTSNSAPSTSGYLLFSPTDGERGLVASYPPANRDTELPMASLEFPG